MSTGLCQSFKEIGHRVSRDLRHAWTANLSFGEETITETNLLEFKRNHPRQITLRSFTKHQEALNGADWEWWFVDRSKTIGYPIRIQAKRLPKNSGKFKNLLKYRSSGATATQIDTLISDAQSIRMTPLHCFYLEEGRMRQSMLSSQIRSKGFNPQYELGCWMGLSVDIKRTRRPDLNGLSKILFPWHRLVCPRISTDNSGLSLPQLVQNNLIRIVSEQETNFNSGEEVQALQELPGYINQILDGGLDGANLSPYKNQI